MGNEKKRKGIYIADEKKMEKEEKIEKILKKIP